MEPIRYLYFAISFNLALWTAPMGYEMIGKDLTYGIWWVAVISYAIIRHFRPKPLPDIVDVEFREIKFNDKEVIPWKSQNSSTASIG